MPFATAVTGPVCGCDQVLATSEFRRQLSMAANNSSQNTTNIITALGNAFKDSGAAMSNDRLATVLWQNMSQLTDLAKQGKLNQQQIMQVCH